MVLNRVLQELDLSLAPNNLVEERFRTKSPTGEFIVPLDADTFGFEKIHPTLLEPPAHSFTAFEALHGRYAIDALKRNSSLGRAFLRAFGYSPEEMVVKHTLDHLRKPELYILVGIPLYDLQLAMNIAYHTARLCQNRTVTKYRRYQLRRWESRFFDQDFLGECIKVCQQVLTALRMHTNFFEIFPSAANPQFIKYPNTSGGNEVVWHNLQIWRRHYPEILRPELVTIERHQFYALLAQGINIPGGVLAPGVGEVPYLEGLEKGLELYSTYCQVLRDKVFESHDLLHLGEWQAVYEQVFSQYSSHLPNTNS